MSIQFKTESRLPTKFGDFKLLLFKSSTDNKEHLAMVYPSPSELKKASAPLVRIHSECLTGEVLGSLRCDCREQLDNALEKIAHQGCGVLLYLRQEGRGIGLEAKLEAYNLQDKGFDTIEANEQLGFDADLRNYDTAAAILNFLDINKLTLLTNNPQKKQAMTDCGFIVDSTQACVSTSTEHNKRYLETKVKKFGHHGLVKP